jgi:citrate lyase subunit beta/citryl-CoA lyase
VQLAAGAHGKAAIDTVHLVIEDLDGLLAEATDAVASGFAATACIHPAQVPVIREAYRPTRVEVERARAIIAASKGTHGVFVYDGRMIDSPVLKQAEALLRREHHAESEVTPDA